MENERNSSSPSGRLGGVSREKQLEVILTLCVALLVIYFVTKQQHRVLITISVAIGLIGMFSKFLTAIIAKAWLKLSELMGAVMGRVILSIVFFVVVFPMAMLTRLFTRKDELGLKKSTATSFYHTRNHRYEAKDMEDVW